MFEPVRKSYFHNSETAFDARRSCRNFIHAGLSLLPLQERSKKPLLKGWQEKLVTTQKQLSKQLQCTPKGNFGVACGGAEGLVVLDVDGKQGKKALKRLQRLHGKLPRTVEVITPGGGVHLYFKFPSGQIGNSVSKLGTKIDVRGAGGYVVCPGSRHPNGGGYNFRDGHALDETEIRRLPSWLAGLLVTRDDNNGDAGGGPTDLNVSSHYAVRALELESARVLKAPLHTRNHTLNRASFRIGQLVGAKLLSGSVAEAELTKAAVACGLDNAEIPPTIRSGLEAGMKSPRKIGGKGSTLTKPPVPSSSLSSKLARLGETDIDNAKRFVIRFGNRLLWTPSSGWFIYDGVRWQEDVLGLRMGLAIKAVKAIRNEAKYLASEEDRRRRKGFSKLSQNKGALDRMLAIAQHEVAAREGQLDADPFLLNVSNGTIDLRTQELLPHSPDDLITKVIDVPYMPKAKSKLFKTFLLAVCGGDKSMARFLRKAVGYTLTGSAREQVLFFLLGPSRTGKSTFINLLRDLLGEYGMHTSSKTFQIRRFDSEIPTEEARMKGARMVTAIENNPNQQLDEAKIKAMTGGDKIVARKMRQDSFEFLPEFKIWMGANDPPKVRATDDAIWNRFVVLSFRSQVEGKAQDDKLPAKLRSEFPAILAWAVRGTKLWVEEGLTDKRLFDHVKADWRRQTDTVSAFFRACCQAAEPNSKVQSSVLYARYKQWCSSASERPSSDKIFKARLLEMDIRPMKDRAGQWWLGINLIA